MSARVVTILSRGYTREFYSGSVLIRHINTRRQESLEDNLEPSQYSATRSAKTIFLARHGGAHLYSWYYGC